MKKIIIFSFIILILLFTIGCKNKVKEFTELRNQAIEMCKERNGELISFGNTYNPITSTWHFESVCYKSDERHFYHDILK